MHALQLTHHHAAMCTRVAAGATAGWGPRTAPVPLQHPSLPSPAQPGIHAQHIAVHASTEARRSQPTTVAAPSGARTSFAPPRHTHRRALAACLPGRMPAGHTPCSWWRTASPASSATPPTPSPHQTSPIKAAPCIMPCVGALPRATATATASRAATALVAVARLPACNTPGNVMHAFSFPFAR